MFKNCKFKFLFSICCLVLGIICSVRASNETTTISTSTSSTIVMPENKTSIGFTNNIIISNTSTHSSIISKSKKPIKPFGSLEFTKPFTRVLISSTKKSSFLKGTPHESTKFNSNSTLTKSFKRLNDLTTTTTSFAAIKTSLETSTFITETITTTTTAPTTTTTTTTTIPIPIYAHILDFKLIKSTFIPDTNTIEIGYIINANVTNIESHILIDIEINCSCAKTNQTWLKVINGQSVSLKTFYFTTPMSPRIQPIPGSFILCQATASNLNLKEQNFSNFQSFSIIYLLIDPLPATSLVLKSINTTSLQLNWQKPIYLYDSLQIICYLNEINGTINDHQSYLNQTIFNNMSDSITNTGASTNQFLVIDNLTPGANYNCTIYTIRYENEEFLSTVKSQTVQEMTKLSEPIIIEGSLEINNSNSIKFKLKPPNGFYDYFQIDLNDVTQKSLVSITQNFTFVKDFSTNIDIEFSDSKQAQIIPSHIYELWCKVFRNNETHTVKLSSSFAIKPEAVISLNSYILSNTELMVAWRPAHNSNNVNNQKYLLNVFQSDKIVYTTKTTEVFVQLSNITSSLNYLIKVHTCIQHKTECDIFSEPTSLNFSLENTLISEFKANKLNTKIEENMTGILLEWHLSHFNNLSELCDISNYHITFGSDHLKSCMISAQTPELVNFLQSDVCKSKIYLNSTMSILDKCNDLGRITCTPQFKCSVQIKNLNFNANYNVSISILSKNGIFERPSRQKIVRTGFNRPSNRVKLTTSHEHSQKYLNSYLINIVEPYVNQKNGPIQSAYLFLVKLDNLSQLNNSAHSKFTINPNDQFYLKNLIESSESNFCEFNYTQVMDPCVLRIYTHNENQFKNEERIVFIGQLMENLNELLPNLTSYENITTEIIEPNNIYQLFYAFKIGDESTSDFIYYASELTEPIYTKYYSSSILSNLSKREGIAVWVIIVTSVISAILLITFIIILVVLILTRYKPSKFHKAAQAIVSNHNQSRMGQIGSSLSMRINNKMSMDKCVDEFMGLSSDFVVPGEFSRHQMTNIWLVKHANGDLILSEEYSNLPDYRDRKTCFASELLKNENKNRFLDIKAYDDSRVILDNGNNNNNNNKIATSQNSVNEKSILASMSTSTSSNNSQYTEVLGDYINANFIQGFSHDKKFIATQGPKKETIADFWRMVFQYRISAIVMLTKLVERGVERCTQYWPEKLNISETYGDFEVTMKDQQKCGDYIKRTFDLVNLNYTNIAATSTHTTTTTTSTPGSLSIHNKRILSVTQYYYGEWPDKEEPSTDPISILHLIRDVNQNHMSYQYPIVVHCSAGVGRTGTYITLDAMMEKIESESKIDIYGFISKIRERRQYLVQTSKQYIFIHEALYEYCLYGFTDIEPARLVSHYKFLKELSPVNSHGLLYTNKTNKTRLQIEFEKLTNAFAPNSQAREAMNNENRSRNRNFDIICYDDNRVKLSSLNGSSYINATKIKGYDLTHSEFIITQDPLPNTQFEFWKMIAEYECNVIVALNKDYEKESVYWPNEQNPVIISEVEDHKYVIQLIKNKNLASENKIGEEFLTRRQFEITETKYSTSSKIIITHFVFNETWLEDRAPQNRANFINLVNQVQKAASEYNRTCVVVHAHGGGSNCSLFCALSILLDQFKNDQYVDVCRSVKKLKTQRPHMIETYEQYEFLYQSLVDFVDMFGTYFQNTDSLSQNSLEYDK